MKRTTPSLSLALTLALSASSGGAAPSSAPGPGPAPSPDSNPFLEKSALPFDAPPFDRIRESDYAPAIEEGMKQQLAEIEAGDIASAAEAAKERGLTGKWVLTLQNTTQRPALSSLTNRALRQKLFEADALTRQNGQRYPDIRRPLAALLLPVVLAAIPRFAPAAGPDPAAPAGSNAPAGAAAAEVERLEKELVGAIAKTDLATYDRIVADDYIAYEASGKENAKADILASYRAGARRYTNLEIFEVRGRVHGDTAVVAARTRGFRRDGDKDVPNNVRYIRVYARRDGKWRAVAQLSTPIPQPPA